MTVVVTILFPSLLSLKDFDDGFAFPLSLKYVDKFIDCKFTDSTLRLLPMNSAYLKKANLEQTELEGKDMMGLREE
ncbi:hypothetical protein N0V84_001092 [Fusarium piperis]|uniref:Uncharacterized protein n=1 Tax=Fusarium piperis TaxID=1435070 RepID=A0A9W8WMH3_9HYPO|nr:hypothetical protein N0V84_001092 [Fusarium piperis]